MKIMYFRLMGYVKVLNGMGLDEIVIDFSQFKNRIVLIQGENGCSKSTIIQALTPNPDSSDSFRTDVFIDEKGNRQIIEYPAEKEIHFAGKDELNNDAYYKILIKSIVDDSKTRRTTKAFISKNGEELNPNGNVSSFKEIRDTLLGIDPMYLDLSSISAENRGIVDMIPSDRRRYMASYVGSLETYNHIYKVISKKVSNLKSYMNTLNAKIYELGNEDEMRLQLMQLNTSLKNKKDSRDKSLKQLAEAEATVNLVDPEGKMQALYESISDRIVIINSEIAKNEASAMSLSSEMKMDNDFSGTDVSNAISDANDLIKTYNDTISTNKSRISTLMSLNESSLQKIESDRSILVGLETNIIQDNIEKVVEDLKSEIDMFEKSIDASDIEILKSTTVTELSELKDTLDSFSSEVNVAEEMHYNDDFIIAVDLCGDSQAKIKLQNIMTSNSSIIATNKARIEKLKEDYNSLSENLSKIEKFQSMRPAECVIDSCPYIANYISIMNNMGTEEDLKAFKSEIELLNSENERLELEMKSSSNVFEIIEILNPAVMSLLSKKRSLSKFSNLAFLCDINEIRNRLKAHYNIFKESGYVYDLIGKYKVYEQICSDKEQLKSLEGDLKIYRNNKALKDQLLESIKSAEEENSKNAEDIKALTKNNMFLTNLINELEAKLSKLESLLSAYNKINSLKAEKSTLKAEFDSVKDKIKLVKEKMDSLNSIKNEINNIEESIIPITNAISELNFNLTSIMSYQKEFAEISEKHDKMLFIRNACNPGNGLGIQSEYVKRYMNDIIIDCNKLLSFMFNGQIRLDIPLIDEKHFSIPFIGPNGIVVPDISCGSTAQKCMIGLVFSCVAMMKSSIRYNIPRFDEIDGGLDQDNRITFINVLNNILDFMDSEQCIICSHNSEFDTQNITRLLFSHLGIKVEQ